MTQFTQALAAFAANPATPSVRALETARLSTLDWVAVGLAGITEDVSTRLRGVIEAEGASGAAHGFGSGPMPARTAAWLNGTTSHALDYDDTHFAHIGHPSVAVLSAALAQGEAQDLPVSRVIEAALVGMELSVRVGLWLGRAHYQVGFHQTATAGAFGATAAAGRLRGFDAATMEQALGLCATQAAGLKAQFGTMGKPYNAGLAARAGVEAADLIAAGFTSNPQAVDGPFGFGATHHGEDAVAQALDGLGEVWLFESVSHKFHACCHGLHAALEALRDLDAAEPEVAKLTVYTHPRWMSVCNQPTPTTGLGAKFSYRTALAMAMTGYDTARLESYSDVVCADARVVGLRDRIDVVEDAALSETQARLELLARNGQSRVVTHDLNAEIELEVRRARIEGKARALIGDMTDEVLAVIDRDGPARALGQSIAKG